MEEAEITAVDVELPIFLLRRSYRNYYHNRPLTLNINGHAFEWQGLDVSIDRLKLRARQDSKSFSDVYLHDYYCGLLWFGRMLMLGRLFPDAAAETRRCAKCQLSKDIREFQVYHEPKDWDGQARISIRTKCRDCHSRYISGRRAKDRRKAKRQAVKRTLKKHRGFSDTYIAELTEAEGYRVGSKLVKEIRQEMEDSGELPKAQYYTSRDGRVYTRK